MTKFSYVIGNLKVFSQNGFLEPLVQSDTTEIEAFLHEHPDADVLLPAFFGSGLLHRVPIVLDLQMREIAEIDCECVTTLPEAFGSYGLLRVVDPDHRPDLFNNYVAKPNAIELVRRLGIGPLILDRMRRFVAGDLQPPDPQQRRPDEV